MAHDQKHSPGDGMTVQIRLELILGPPYMFLCFHHLTLPCQLAQSIIMSLSATGGSSKGLTQLPSDPVSTASASTTQPIRPPLTPARAPPPPPPPPSPLPPKSIKHHTKPLNPDVLHVAPYQSSPRHLPIFLVGISGAPSSGKATLSRTLAKVFPSGTISFVFDEDDYVLLSKSSVTQDAGPHAAMASAQLVRILKELKENGKLPPRSKTLHMSQGGPRGAEHLVKPETACELGEVAEKLGPALGNRKIGIVKGLLPYGDALVRDLLDVKLFLPVSMATAKESCLARFSHLPSVGKDYRQAVEYFENVVWPKYARVNSSLFRHGDVEGSVKKRVCRELEIDVRPRLNSMGDTLKWAVDVIIRELKVKNERSNPSDNMCPNDQYELCHCHDGVLGRVRQFLFDLL